MQGELTDPVAEYRAVAGAVSDPGIAAKLDATAFSNEQMRDYATAISAIHGRGEKVTPFSVAKETRDSGCEAVLEGLVQRYGSMSAEAAIREVGVLRTRREVLRVCRSAYEDASDLTKDVDSVLSKVEGEVLSLTTTGTATSVRDGANLTESLDDFAWRVQNPGKIRGMTTGFKNLDKLLDGLKGGKSYLIGARPGVGKSALAKDISEPALLRGRRVMTFSLEMDAKECQDRMLSSVSGIPIGGGQIYSAADAAKVEATARRLRGVDWVIDDTPGLRVDQFRSKARAAHREDELDLIVIDYIQLMRGSEERSRRDRRLEVGEISAAAKNIARELRVPVLSLAQLKRPGQDKFNPDTHAYETPVPKLSDLKESGDLEQDADGVILIHRDPMGDSLILAKNRGGPTGIVNVEWIPHLTKFREI